MREMAVKRILCFLTILMLYEVYSLLEFEMGLKRILKICASFDKDRYFCKVFRGAFITNAVKVQNAPRLRRVATLRDDRGGSF